MNPTDDLQEKIEATDANLNSINDVFGLETREFNKIDTKINTKQNSGAISDASAAMNDSQVKDKDCSSPLNKSVGPVKQTF